MAQIQTKFLQDDAVTGDKFRLDNAQYLRGRNNADNADVDIIRVNATDALELAAKLNDPSDAAPTADTQLANKKYVDDQVATITIPTVFELQGNWSAATNTPTLANTDTGVADYLYYVNAAGSVDFGAGSITFAVGDWVYNVNGAWEKADNNDDVLSVAGKTGIVTLDTSDVSEDVSALYFTDARARTAAVVNSTAGNETDQAASVDAMKTYVTGEVAAVQGADSENEVTTLIAGDITNQYLDLGFEALVDSVTLYASGLKQVQGVDYTLNYTGGAGSVTRVTFAGDIATGGPAALVAGDVVEINYLRA